MPPAALISLTASSTPFLKLVPADAPAPESSTMFESLIAWACAPMAERASTADTAMAFSGRAAWNIVVIVVS
jgi:hypothetical protein